MDILDMKYIGSKRRLKSSIIPILQKAIDDNDMSTLKTKLDALEQAANAMAEHMYQQQSANPTDMGSNTANGSTGDDNVVDADFKETK